MQKTYSTKFIIITVLAASAGFFLLNYFINGFFVLGDDTYIYLQYARNYIEHGQFAFNKGEISYGYTSPLWLWLIIATIKFSHEYLSSPGFLTMLFSFLTILLWIRIIYLQKWSRAAFVFGILVIVFEPNLGKHAFLGMEAILSFFLSTYILYLILNKQPNYIAFGIVFGLSVLVRPESALIGVIILLYLLFL